MRRSCQLFFLLFFNLNVSLLPLSFPLILFNYRVLSLLRRLLDDQQFLLFPDKLRVLLLFFLHLAKAFHTLSFVFTDGFCHGIGAILFLVWRCLASLRHLTTLILILRFLMANRYKWSVFICRWYKVRSLTRLYDGGRLKCLSIATLWLYFSSFLIKFWLDLRELDSEDLLLIFE